jgi:hypothetical protein
VPCTLALWVARGCRKVWSRRITLNIKANAYSCYNNILQQAKSVNSCCRTTTRSPVDGKSILSSPYYAYLPGSRSDIRWSGFCVDVTIVRKAEWCCTRARRGWRRLCSPETVCLFAPSTIVTNPKRDIRTLHPRLASSPPMS